jgi:hypothetical protein
MGANLPIQAAVEDISYVPENVEYAQALMNSLEKARQDARKCIERAQEAQKRNYDLHHQVPVEYEHGTLVSYQVPGVTNDRLPKMEYTWSGPFQIMERTSELNYRIRDMRYPGTPSKVVHVRHLKPWYDPAFRKQFGLQEELDIEPLEIDLTKSVRQSVKEPDVPQSPVNLDLSRESTTNTHKLDGNDGWKMFDTVQYPDAVTMENLEPDEEVGVLANDDFEVWAILAQRRKKSGKKFIMEYLLRFKGYGSEYDLWVPQSRIFAHDLLQAFQDRKKGKQLVSSGKPKTSVLLPPSEADMSI